MEWRDRVQVYRLEAYATGWWHAYDPLVLTKRRKRLTDDYLDGWAAGYEALMQEINMALNKTEDSTEEVLQGSLF